MRAVRKRESEEVREIGVRGGRRDSQRILPESTRGMEVAPSSSS